MSDGILFKILHRERFERSEREGRLAWADVDVRDGFVHLSSAAQVRETARLHFAGQDGLVLVAIDASRLAPGSLRWEPSRNGALFPHVYGDVPLAAIAWSAPLPRGEDGLVFPAGV